MQTITEAVNLFFENHELKDEFDMTTSELDDAYLKLKDIIDNKDELWKLLHDLFCYGFSKGYQQKEAKTIRTLELNLSDDIADVENDIEKATFLLNEFDVYDYTHDVNPNKAVEYARNENKSEDYKLSFDYCNSHKRVMYLYHIIQDYVYEAQSKLEIIVNRLNEGC